MEPSLDRSPKELQKNRKSVVSGSKSVTFYPIMTLKATTKKVALGFFIAIFVTALAAPASQVQAYYYQTQYQYQYQQPVVYQTNIQALYNQLYALMAQLAALQNQQGHGYTPTYPPTYSNKDYDVEVDTEDVELESDDAVSFEGDIELDGAPYATVWFEYGEGGDLTEKTGTKRVTRDGSFQIEEDDLDDDERYYVRAVAEDPSGVRTYGTLLAFTIEDGYDDDDDDDDRRDDDTPEATTEDARSIREYRAELRGEIEMNDFEDGTVFFVYGEDEDLVEDAEDEDSFSDIDEEGNDLQTVRVFNGLDDTREFRLTVSGLDDDTDHYFRICVEYEDEDGDDALECGDVESFTTEEY